MKKMISVFLTISLVFSLLPMAQVFATESSGSVRIEYENYAKGILGESVKEVAGASGGKVLHRYYDGEVSDPDENKVYQIPVKIQKSGYYKLEFATNPKPSGDVYSYTALTFSLSLNGTDYKLPVSNKDTPTKNLDYTATSDKLISLFNYEKIWIDAGDYTLNTMIEEIYGFQYKYQLDYFEFKYLEPPKISQGNVTKIETDEYAGPGVYDWDRGVKTLDGASGNKIVFKSGSADNPSWSFKVNVTESGFYHINYSAGLKSQVYFSLITFKVGNVTVGDNSSKFDHSEKLDIAAWLNSDGTAVQSMYKFRNEWVWLDKGEYDLSVEVEKSGEQYGAYKYQIDYIEFIPAANGISKQGDTIKVHATYTDFKEGKVLMALYDGSALVGTKFYNLDGDFIDLDYTTDKKVTKVKVFLWEGTNLKPKELSKDFDLE